jgi:diguanylate cyclase (GGDEF)-like protein
MAELARHVASHGLEHLLGSTCTGVALLDSTGGILIANPAFSALQQGVPGSKTILDLVPPERRESLGAALKKVGKGRSVERLQMDFQSESGPVDCDCLLSRSEGGRLLLFAEPLGPGPLRDRDRLREELEDARTALANKNIELQAVIAQADEVVHTDPLTLLPNRRLILAECQREVTRSERYASPLTVSMLDLDNFKLVNDRFGHAAGDRVLSKVSTELRAHIRQPDEIGRYGGDEFLVILPDSTTSAAAEQANRLCQQVRSMELAVRQEVVRLTLSVGIAQLKPRGEGWQGLLERADRALYQAKGAGGNQWKISEG